jgi:hypothetical protein
MASGSSAARTGIPGSSGAAVNPSSTLLSPRQKRLFQAWLEEYRKKWSAYWNYLPNPCVAEIVEKVCFAVLM